MKNTKVISLEPISQKKIEFCAWLSDCGLDKKRKPYEPVWKGLIPPNGYDKIVLICQNHLEKDNIKYDLMYANDNDVKNGSLYLGHFNDGIV
jgi:hypothetical protein